MDLDSLNYSNQLNLFLQSPINLLEMQSNWLSITENKYDKPQYVQLIRINSCFISACSRLLQSLNKHFYAI